ncbi:late competence protein ComER [Bacillus sp. AGMB 02131]|uniref:Late competence protein ComER n=1 Tax=Peribacillus faecalis TaxID=2772559 RepID=A0A927D1V1_9BACI|nr:late competence protein ComER [Peribacillus faecalis]MBD3109980.1 late competence protein ComER [Peribacillus faecalis]
MKVAVIGTGNMGTILIEAFILSDSVLAKNMNIYNRTQPKAQAIKAKYPNIHLCSSEIEAAQNSELIFVCVKPGEMHTVLSKLAEHLYADQCVVSITSPISVAQLEEMLPCNTARLIPSITNKVFSGVSLLSFGENCSNKWREAIRQLASNISEAIEIDNNITRISSDIVSCGPAFFSYLAQAFINAAVEETKIDPNTATVLTEKMLIGLGDLLRSGQYTLPTLQEKVCVKGGITGEGIKVFEQELGDVFNRVFLATHEKFGDEITKLEKQFEHKY